MRIRFFLAVAAIALVTGCGDDRKSRTEPTPSPTPMPAQAPAAVEPEASETALATVNCPSPQLPAPKPDDTAIEPATYVVCDIGDPADSHPGNGATLSGKHLDLGNPVTVCDVDEATRVKLPGKEFDTGAFIVDGKARQLKGLARFTHDNGSARHLVKITRANKEYMPPLDENAPRCDKDQHQIIRIQFCYFGPTGEDPSEKWRCPGEGPGESGAHQGDIHAQN